MLSAPPPAGEPLLGAAVPARTLPRREGVDGLCRSLLEELPGAGVVVFDAGLSVVDTAGPPLLGSVVAVAGRPLHQVVSPHAWAALRRHFLAAAGGRSCSVRYTSEEGERFALRFGRGHVIIRPATVDAAADEARHWIERIGEALAHHRFVLHAQPIVELATGRRVQHELLLRMRDELGSLVSPGAFLPVAEAHGLIGDVDRWVIRQACRLAGDDIPVEVNLSAASIGDPALRSFVEDAVGASGADPSLLVFEITETALLCHEAVAERFLHAVRALGCGVALDDFGTGYGGFTYLKRLPVDFLKIDVEFVRELPHDRASRHVVEAVVSLARGFGVRTIAEGVEDAHALRMLAELGVDLAQGFGICRPGPAEQVLARVAGD